jgi:hypothetical protein
VKVVTWHALLCWPPWLREWKKQKLFEHHSCAAVVSPLVFC